jgi:superfamily I DNA/RNA helicase
MARFIVAEPDHHGVATALRHLATLRETRKDFASIEIDCWSEFWDAVRLDDFEEPGEGFAEITHRRTYSRPQPPTKAISTVHKAKGLECDSVVLMPCDARTFPNNVEARCLLYVALSRAKSRLLLVVPRSDPSPWLGI